ncbi:SGNH/GDSL hydrolase family protein [Actinomadura sp. ATCC 31491]|uniref:SGNH/GDSL hydrolase family protein n=1 Tax=Actinomadura luzonensis TaxID=2805427 RepID=A0ABT0G1R0_9ACTN|nr:SGNH/GDSL hydrolase family protein [Actinomadura luzonensis]MCK2218459.1 SGNH/GDSL hydrolase family protein [Actinomadura luzonensis]
MRARASLAAVLSVSVVLSTPLAARAAPTPPPSSSSPDQDLTVPPTRPAAPESVAPAERAALLGGGWAKSSDRAVTTAGDATGFHVLVADAKDGYRWRTAASLSEPGFDTDTWIGNVCVTASGERAVVVYGPRTFTNKAELADRGGFTAIVDLDGGPVRKLNVQTSLAYFNPGCGPSESAVLTQGGGEDLAATRLLELDTVKGKVKPAIEVPGQLTSAVPTGDGIVAADSGALVRVRPDGEREVLARTRGVPYRLAPDAAGGVVYAQVEDARTASVRRVDLAGGNAVTVLATGGVTGVSVRSARGGQVYVTGAKATKARAAAPPGVTLADVPDDAGVSLSGEVAVTSVTRTHTKDPRVPPADPGAPQRVDITATSLATGKPFTLAVTPAGGAGGGALPSPALGRVAPAAPAAAGDPHDPADGDQRYCSVARNDPRSQAMQPKPRQVEWAVDQAVYGRLTVQRPANWKNLGMPAYTPQGLFPPRTLDGGGRVPAQVLLGVATQESNTWQAARFAIPGTTANPLIGNYFGIDYYNDDEGDDWTIDWAEADCGYGIMQVTDGMRVAGKEKPGETALPLDQQRAIALDFAANIAKGMQMLQDKWNETRRAGLKLNNGSADRIENWFFAAWAYNSGFHPDPGGGKPWGVGWLNNPVNPRYPADRTPFMEESYADAAHPQDWPYPEKVMGFAGHPIELIETPGNLVHNFVPAWWLTNSDRYLVQPPVTLFCDASNDCRPGASYPPDAPEVIGEPAGPCAHRNSAGQYDLQCWYHAAATWKDDCPSDCGHEFIRFDPGYAYQEDGTNYPPNCGLTGLPSGALVVDNLAKRIPSVRPNCAPDYNEAGSFQFTFRPNAAGNYPGKIDVHQIGSGFAGQFWMSDTIPEGESARSAVGTWTLNQSAGWARVFVHLPVVGARTQQARYEIDVDGSRSYRKHRYLPQALGRNGWVSLGVYDFNGTVPSVRLGNITEDGKGTVRVAWDAIAVQKLAAKPRHIVAALGDSYSSGEGAGNYFSASDTDHGTPSWNACRRSNDAYPRKVVLPGDSENLGTLVDRFDPGHELGFVACSGAQTWNVTGDGVPWSWQYPDRYGEGEGQFHEIAQLDSGVLDENTTLVTLTLGGNDEGAFTNALSSCIIPFVECGGDSFMPTYKAIIDRTAEKLKQVLREIHAPDRAPNAKIVLLGYPKLIAAGGCSVSGTSLITSGEADLLGQLARYMEGKQWELVSQLQSEGDPGDPPFEVYAASPISYFAGHEACGDGAWINPVMLTPNGEGDYHEGDARAKCIPNPLDVSEPVCLSRESFHPNDQGTSAYASTLAQTLSLIGYRGAQP